MASSTKDCQVCCSAFTAVLRKPTTCPYCQFEACQECVKRYILSSTTDPQCMSCHIPWSREYLDTIFSKAFRTNEYKKHREDVLLDREKSLLPATIPFLKHVLRKRAIRDLEASKNTLKGQIREIDIQMYTKKENRELETSKGVLNEQMRVIEQKIYKNERRIFNAEEKKRKVFMKACAVQDCRGFLSSQWKCGICSTKVCHLCHEIKADEKKHECDPNNVETAKLLAKDTKPCPKCASGIFKVSGCDLMFCTICHVSFSWTSGKEVDPVNNHNPHYIDYTRRTNNGCVPRTPGDIPMTCGGIPSIRQLDTFVKNNIIHDSRLYNLLNLAQTLNHIREVEVLPERTENVTLVNQDIRIRYLLNEISVEEWKRELQKREKKSEVKKARRLILEMLLTASADILNKLVLSNGKESVSETLDELQTLLDYYNTSSEKMDKRFCIKSSKLFDEQWIWGNQR